MNMKNFAGSALIIVALVVTMYGLVARPESIFGIPAILYLGLPVTILFFLGLKWAV